MPLHRRQGLFNGAVVIPHDAEPPTALNLAQRLPVPVNEQFVDVLFDFIRPW